MSEPVIKVENLGKKYIISHKSGAGAGHSSFPTLRDQMTNTAKRLKERAAATLTGKKTTRPACEEFWALQQASFEVQKGERLGIIGRNGAGKSTLLKLLSRITEPSTGKIILNGRVASLLEVGTGFHPELTGRENIYLNGSILGMSRSEIKRKFDEIVAFSGVERFLDTPVKRYSSGMYVRLAFAVAAHLEPEILIVDEVLAVGDIQFQKKCLGKMEDLSESTGRTVLFVSHNMDAVQRLCSRCIMMEQGQILIDSDTNSATKKYISRNSGKAMPNQWISLSNTRHQGTGEARFQSLQYSSLHPDVANFPYSGGPLEFLVAIESKATFSVDSLAIMIKSQGEVKLLNADTAAIGQQLELRKGNNCFKLAIEKLSLNAGLYVVGLWLDRTGKSNSGDEAIDYIESAFEFEVVQLETKGFRDNILGFVTCDFQVSKIS